MEALSEQIAYSSSLTQADCYAVVISLVAMVAPIVAPFATLVFNDTNGFGAKLQWLHFFGISVCIIVIIYKIIIIIVFLISM